MKKQSPRLTKILSVIAGILLFTILFSCYFLVVKIRGIQDDIFRSLDSSINLIENTDISDSSQVEFISSQLVNETNNVKDWLIANNEQLVDFIYVQVILIILLFVLLGLKNKG